MTYHIWRNEWTWNMQNEIGQSQKGKSWMIPPEASKRVKLLGAESSMVVTRNCRKGENGDLLFCGYTVSVMYARWNVSRDLCSIVPVVNKMYYTQNFLGVVGLMLSVLSIRKKEGKKGRGGMKEIISGSSNELLNTWQGQHIFIVTCVCIQINN